MKRNRIIKKTILSVVCSVFLSSCSEDIMDRINNNNNNTLDAPAKSIITDVMTSTAFNNVGGDISTYVSTYIEHEVGCNNQLHRAEYRNGEPSASSTFNNTWKSIYSTLRNALLVIDKCSDTGSEPGNYVTKGIAEVMVAYNLAILTDLFGDVPWSEACKMNLTFTPKIDKQEDIYVDIMSYLDRAIEDLEKSDEFNPVGSQDLIYKGNNKLWTKAAYGLKARYSLRLLSRTENKTVLLNEILGYIDDSFDSQEKEFSFNIYNGSNINPLFGFYKSVAAIAASQSLYYKLTERNDPRANALFIDISKKKVITPSVAEDLASIAKNGEVVQGSYINAASIFVAAQSASTHLMSCHELMFIKAEVLARLDKVQESKKALKEAVVLAFANASKSIEASYNSNFYGGFIVPNDVEKLTVESANNYFDNNVSDLFDKNPLKEVMIQKYLGMFGANGEAVEAYSDYRRMCSLSEDFIELKNPNNANNKFPLRLPYGNSDTTANPNVKAAYGNGSYVYKESVWWSGGTR